MLLQISYDDFQEFASLRKELHKLQVALEFYQKTTGQFNFDDLKVCTSQRSQRLSRYCFDCYALSHTWISLNSTSVYSDVISVCLRSFQLVPSWQLHVHDNLVHIINLSSYGFQQRFDHPQQSDHSTCTCR